MKAFTSYSILIASLAFSLTVPSLLAENLPSPTEYRVVEQGAHHNVWQRETFEQTPDGNVVTKTNQYTELATGLNYQDAKGQWQPAQDEITVLPDGTAAAVRGQHKAYFPGDIYEGTIRLITPDGQVMQSQPSVLSYSDGNNTALIGILTNSTGYLAASNQVIYPNAFSGINADLRYTYTKAGFEQDVILHEQPPLPASLGLNPETTRIQVLTEFLSAPTPKITQRKLPTRRGQSADDEELTFGDMTMVPGKAFSLGHDTKQARVRKSWVKLQGRQFLLEEVPTAEVETDLESLPVPAQQTRLKRPQPALAKELVLPSAHLVEAKPHGKGIQLALADHPASGLVLDYNTVNPSLTNFTFQGDQTYYVSGAVNLYGTTTFEGGTVLKYPTNSSVQVTVQTGGILCKTKSYSPAVFTSKNDNSVGQTVSGSSGSPAMGSALYLYITTDTYTNLHDLRFAYAGSAISSYYLTENIRNSVFLKCSRAVTVLYDDLLLFNVLFAGCSYAIDPIYSGTIIEENVTTDGSSMDGTTTTLCLTNCVFTVDFGGAGTLNASDNVMTYDPHEDGFSVVSLPYFQSAGGGNYYLTNNSALRNIGTTNIDADLLVDLANKTTYPPIGYSNVVFSSATTFSPQAQRDGDGLVDLGYHYDPLDYLF
ncbi:MAG TPA: hypothetical protein VGO57_14740, partial [Verrucomicrobiae bacterium]